MQPQREAPQGRFAPLEISEPDEFEDVVLSLEAEQQRYQARSEGSWWARLRQRLPAWAQPAPQPFAFTRLDQGDSHEHEEDATGAAGGADARRPKGRWCPEENASFLSRLLFLYVGPLVKMGYLKTLDQEDLWDVAAEDEAQGVAEAFTWHLRTTVNPTTAPQGVIWRAMWRAHGRAFIISGLVKFVHDIVMFAGPVLLEQLLKHVQAGGGGWLGLGLASALAGSAVVETLTINWYFHQLFRMSLQLKVGLVDSLFRKSLRVSSAAKSEAGVGAVVNLQSNDAAKLWNLPQYMHMIWSGPLQILVVMALLVRVIHWVPALAGLAVTIAFIPASTWLGKKIGAVRKELVKLTDARVKLCTEVITGIKAIKLYAWEQPYVERITSLREQELRCIRRSALLGTMNSLVFTAAPTLISLAAFLAYALLGYPLTASVAFPALSLFNLLRFPVAMFPQQIMNLINGRVAMGRIQAFMEVEEMSQPPLLQRAVPPAPAVEIQGGSFAWRAAGGMEAALLKDIDLAVGVGELVIVVGSVGSGKSSLLAAVLGEMAAVQGSVRVRGRVALTQQDPWIQNATLRDNILMGAPLDQGRYQAVLEACALLPDLEMLPAGDETEIGEKGVNLSGGQRHRVALARAAYAAADVLLLDDPLSAVDAHVGRHLFDKCICGLLGKATRVLVTHQLQYLGAADTVLVVREGRIAHRGSYQELMARGVDFHQFEVESADESEGESEAAAAAGGGSAEAGREAQSGRQEQNSSLLAREAEEEELGGSEAKLLAQSLAAAAGPAAAGGAAGGTIDAAASALCVAVETAAVAGPGAMAAAAVGASEVRAVNGGAAANGVAANGVDGSAIVTLANGVSGRGGGAGSPPISPARKQAGEAGEVAAGYKFSPKAPLPTAPTRRDLCGGAQAAAAAAASGTGLKAGQLTKKEERAVGQVDRAVYRAYFAAWSPRFVLPLTVLGLAVIERGMLALQNWWLSVWSNATSAAAAELAPAADLAASVDTAYYLGVYFAFGLSSLTLLGVRAVLLVFGTVNAARSLQSGLLSKVVTLPQSFFDSQPTGRLLNRFTKDTEAVDTAIAGSVLSFLNCAVSVLWSMVVVVAVSPAILAAIVPLAVTYSWVQARYIRSSRELKRLDSLALSPIFGHFSETLHGLMTVRAFRQQPPFQQRNSQLMNQSNRAYWPAQCVNRWLSVRLELLGISVVFGTAVFVSVVTPRNAGLAGLALTSALNLTGLMNWMVRQTTELEVNMNSVERMTEYGAYESEAPAIIPSRRPLPNWPSRGAIEVDRLVVRYRPDLDPVLKGVSFSIRGREKVGVAGRTGCGKSTLMLALYRLVEPWGGKISIDGIDTSSIGLFDLRSRLALVPQDPVVFSGTIRSNLDPFGDAGSDAAIWGALKQAGLADAVRALEGGLDAQVSEGGSNLSVGQRQLLCMARALLRTARILILDEATSNVDTATDALIQTTIATAFADCTVLTIAHRLHTIMASDRILVLQAGEVLEFDPPATLLRRPGSAFKALVEETARHSCGKAAQ